MSKVFHSFDEFERHYFPRAVAERQSWEPESSRDLLTKFQEWRRRVIGWSSDSR